MKKIHDFNKFVLSEAIINRSKAWPANWKDSVQWKILQILGFEETTTPKLEKNGSIKIYSPKASEYPGGLVLQRSGYVRNPLVQSGWVKRWEGEFTLLDILNYIISRYLPIFYSRGDKERIDNLFKEDPALISILNQRPSIQQEIINRTGIPDFRSVLQNPLW
jgi:hypothetical protein